MWTRVELKENAKIFLKNNYWWCVLVTLIITLIGGGFGNSSNRNNSDSGYNYNYNNYLSDDWYGDYDDVFDSFDDMNSSDNQFDFSSNYFSETSLMEIIANQMGIPYDILIKVTRILTILFVVILVIAMLISFFVLVPIRIGAYRWYIKNRTEKPQFGELGYIFSNGYLNTIKVMFFVGIKTFLWACLFVIPGIVKAYEYRMIPYLLAENPYMESGEAFRRSRDMMDGNKANAFVLDLSFILWYFLAAIPFVGTICAVLWINPYVQLTNVELYVKLCMLTGNQSYQAPTMNNNNYNNDPWSASYNQTNYDAGRSDSSDGFGESNSYNADSFGNKKQSGIDEEMFK